MHLNLNPARPNDIPSLTGLRFFAAFFVLVSHGLLQIMPMNGVAPGWYSFLSTISAEGMTLFFVLSGFVIHYNYSVSIQNNSWKGIYNFFVARFARIYPLFLVGLLFDLAHNYGYSTLTLSFWKAIPYYLTLTQSWFYVPLGSNALIYQFGHIPSVSWSVSTEWFFYMLYPLICFGLITIPRVRSKAVLFFGLSILGFYVLAVLWNKEAIINDWATTVFGSIADERNGFQDSFYRWLVYFSPYSRISEFLLGCITAAIYMQLSVKSLQPKEERFGVLLLIFSTIGVVVLHYFGFSQSKLAASIPYRGFIQKLTLCFGFAPFAAIIIFCCARYQTAFSRFFTIPILLAGGEISYSLYLFHMVVIQAFARDAAPLSSSTSWIVYMADFSRLILTFAAAIGLAILFYRGIEVPARRFLRNAFTIKKIGPSSDKLCLEASALEK